MRVACVGSRDLAASSLAVCRQIGRDLVARGHTLYVGNDPGASQAFAAGGNEVDPARVWLFLPWPGYERAAWVEGNPLHPRCGASYPEAVCALTAQAHSSTKWKVLGMGLQRLAIRTYALLHGYPYPAVPPGEEITPAEALVAWFDPPSNGPGLDTVGAEFVRRLAHEMGLPEYGLHDSPVRQRLLAHLRAN